MDVSGVYYEMARRSLGSGGTLIINIYDKRKQPREPLVAIQHSRYKKKKVVSDKSNRVIGHFFWGYFYGLRNF